MHTAVAKVHSNHTNCHSNHVSAHPYPNFFKPPGNTEKKIFDVSFHANLKLINLCTKKILNDVGLDRVADCTGKLGSEKINTTPVPDVVEYLISAISV